MTQKMVNILWQGWQALLWTCWASDDCGKSKCRWCSVSDWTYSFGVQETDLDRNCRNGSHWVRMLRESVRESERKWHEVEGTPTDLKKGWERGEPQETSEKVRKSCDVMEAQRRHFNEGMVKTANAAKYWQKSLKKVWKVCGWSQTRHSGFVSSSLRGQSKVGK